MSLVVLEGFDDGLRSQRWLYSGPAPAAGSGLNRFGLTVTFNDNNTIAYAFDSAEEDDVVTIGFWCRLGRMPTVVARFNEFISFWGDSGTTRHLDFLVTLNGALQVRRGDLTVIGTSDPIWAGTTDPHYVEIKATLHDSAGTIDILKNGVSVLSLSSQDTKDGGTGTVFDKVQLRDPSANNSSEIHPELDDIYITNEQGPAPYNGYLGPIIVETVFPDGNGNYSDFVGSDGNQIDNHLLVDEEPNHDSDTTYVESSTDTDRDSYTFDDLIETSGDILGVQVTAVMRNTGSTDNVQMMTRISSTDYDSADIAVPASYGIAEHIWGDSPATSSPWTIAEFNAAEFGIENVA